jgi:flavin reductase (DIM6/NTAB) family NADH-FMN oxidoreductase RutF
LFFGHVLALQVAPDGNPLLYHDRHYHFLRNE